MYTQEQAIEKLKELIKPGMKIYTVLRHVSQSGMTRWISVFVCNEKGIHCIDSLVTDAGIGKLSYKYGGIKVKGYGTDMGFAIVNSLSYKLFGDASLKHEWL
ncbi:MAG: hypothetical protein QXS54_06690 [Candidatus Methanomethylicaceae archaeon]